MVVGRRAGDAAEDVASAEPSETVAEALPHEAVPVGVHAPFGRRVGDDRGRPLDRVDLRHHRGVDQAGLVVELLVAPVPVLAAQRVADGVVLADEERVEDGETHPEVPPRADRIEHRIERCGMEPVAADPELAVLARARPLLEGLVMAVDLGAVPPVSVVGRVDGGRPVSGCTRVWRGARDLHLPVGPVVVVELERKGLGRIRVVAHPVVNLELDPGGGQQVERGRGDELGPGEERAGDHARARLELVRLPLGVGAVERDVAAEACARASHRGATHVVPGAVQRPRLQAGRPGGRRLDQPRIGEVLLP